jgi:uncharacterized membrane-anchored protein
MNNKTTATPFKFWILFALVLPLIVLILMITRAELNKNQGTEWDIAITGYDPRDILRGHYLIYNVDYQIKNSDEESVCKFPDDCCLCLKDKGQRTPEVTKLQCEVAKNQCDSFILDDFQHSLNRFYIPEAQAKQAEDLLLKAQAEDNAFLQILVRDTGKPIVKDLLIDEQPIIDLLKK